MQVILAAYGEDYLTYQSVEQIVDECRVEGEEMMREVARNTRYDSDAHSDAAWSEASERLSRLEGQVRTWLGALPPARVRGVRGRKRRL